MSNKDKSQGQNPSQQPNREGDDDVQGNPVKNNPKMNQQSPGSSSSKQDQQSKTQR